MILGCIQLTANPADRAGPDNFTVSCASNMNIIRRDPAGTAAWRQDRNETTLVRRLDLQPGTSRQATAGVVLLAGATNQLGAIPGHAGKVGKRLLGQQRTAR